MRGDSLCSEDDAEAQAPLLSPRLLGRSAEFVRVEQGLRPFTSADSCVCAHLPPESRDDTRKARPPQLLQYSARHLSSILALFRVRGTAFASCSLWVHVLANLVITGVAFCIVFFCSRRPDLIDAEQIRRAVLYGSGLVGFVLVLYLHHAVVRWWAMRRDAVGGLWESVDDLALVLAAHFPDPGSRPLKELVLRYCLASLDLTFMQAQGTDGVLQGLVLQGLLTPDEKRKLEELVSKPQAVWVWVAGIFQQLAERGKLSSRLLFSLYDICAKARGAVGRGRGVFAYLDTQLPFAYVHLISVMVHLCNAMVAVKCGILAAVAARNLLRPETRRDPVSDTENAQVLLMQVAFAVVVPVFYLAFLSVGASVSDPFGDKFEDFPRSAYRTWMRSECRAFHAAGEQLPPEVLRVTDGLEVSGDDFVQDRVVVV